MSLSEVLYQSILKPLLFNLDAETSHRLIMHSGGFVAKHARPIVSAMIGTNSEAGDAVNLFGLNFKNKIGLAAGFDKNGEAIELFTAMGFGHLEIGTITAKAQAGNPRPRIFRFPNDKALINRMGFPGLGAEAAARNISEAKLRLGNNAPILGINIGKSKDVDINEAVSDYCKSFTILSPLADYIAVNVSSPNTPNLRQLQERDKLAELLDALQQLNQGKKPLLVKVAPDLADEAVAEVVELLLEKKISGIIATNTTIGRTGLSVATNEAGGLSGQPVNALSLSKVKLISSLAGSRLPIIGCGGILKGSDAKEFINSGASMVQVYTGLVYRGPALIAEILKSLR